MGEGLDGRVPDHTGHLARNLFDAVEVLPHPKHLKSHRIQGTEMTVPMGHPDRVTSRDPVEIESGGHAAVRKMGDEVTEDPLSVRRLIHALPHPFKNLVDAPGLREIDPDGREGRPREMDMAVDKTREDGLSLEGRSISIRPRRSGEFLRRSPPCRSLPSTMARAWALRSSESMVRIFPFRRTVPSLISST